MRNILISTAASFGWPWEKKKKQTTSVSESCSNIKGNGSFFMQTLGLSCAAFPSMPMNGEV